MFWRKKNKVDEKDVLDYVRDQAKKQRERDILEAKIARTQEIENRKTARQVEHIKSGGLFGIIGRFIKKIMMIPVYFFMGAKGMPTQRDYDDAYAYFTPLKLIALWIALFFVLILLAG
jgi:hypothetical protein